MIALAGALAAEPRIVEAYEGGRFGHRPPTWVALDADGEVMNTRAFLDAVDAPELTRAWRRRDRESLMIGGTLVSLGMTSAIAGVSFAAVGIHEMNTRPGIDNGVYPFLIGSFGAILGTALTASGMLPVTDAARRRRDPSSWLTADEAREWIAAR